MHHLVLPRASRSPSDTSPHMWASQPDARAEHTCGVAQLGLDSGAKKRQPRLDLPPWSGAQTPKGSPGQVRTLLARWTPSLRDLIREDTRALGGLSGPKWPENGPTPENPKKGRKYTISPPYY